MLLSFITIIYKVFMTPNGVLPQSKTLLDYFEKTSKASDGVKYILSVTSVALTALALIVAIIWNISHGCYIAKQCLSVCNKAYS